MKKNYIKKLALTMAFAMVFTSVAPTSTASAAKKPVLNASAKTLLLNGTTSFDFNVKNQVKGSKYSWTSSNKSVATVNKKGIVKAVATGSTKITVSIKTKAGKTIKLTAPVTVKENATALKIDSVSNSAIKVGEAVTLKATPTTKSGKTTTDIVRWEVTSGKENATVTDDGVFTAKTAGEYKVVARTFQSKTKYNAFLKGDTSVVTATAEAATVKVVASMTGAKQASLSTVNVTFDSAMTDVAKNISVYSLAGTTKVKQLVKEVKMDSTNKVATVTLYVPCTAGVTYVVDYPDMKSAEFVAASSKVEDVTSAKIATTQVVFNEQKELDIKLFNKDGVDITNDDLLARVTCTTTHAKSYIDGRKLTMFNKGDITTVTATLHTYKYDTATGAEQGNVVASGTVTAVDVLTVAPGSLQAYTIVKAGTTPDWNNVKHALAAEENYKLYVKVKKGTDDVTNTGSEVSKFKFESSNKDVLIAYNDGTLSPVKEGSAVVVVKYNDSIVEAITINVSAKRKATNLTLDTQAFTLSNTNAFVDSKTVTLKLVDQLGDDFAIEKKGTNSQGYDLLSGAPDAAGLNVSFVGNKITFSAQGKAKGTYQYMVKVNGLERPITINVAAPEGNITGYKLELGAISVDEKVVTKDDGTNDVKNVSVNIFGCTSNGVKNSIEAINGSNYLVEVTNPEGNTDTVTSSAFNVVTAVSGGAYTKIKTGTYRFNLFETKIDNGKVVKVKSLDTQYLQVTDTQVAPVIAEKKKITSKASDAISAIKDCYKITLNGTDVTSSIYIDSTKDIVGDYTNGSVYVKNVRYNEKIGTAEVVHVIKIESYITKE